MSAVLALRNRSLASSRLFSNTSRSFTTQTLVAGANGILNSNNKFMHMSSIFDANAENTNKLSGMNNATSMRNTEVAAGCQASRKFYSMAFPDSGDLFSTIKRKDEVISELQKEVNALRDWKKEYGVEQDDEYENAARGNATYDYESDANLNATTGRSNNAAASVGVVFFFTYSAVAAHMLLLDSSGLEAGKKATSGLAGSTLSDGSSSDDSSSMKKKKSIGTIRREVELKLKKKNSI